MLELLDKGQVSGEHPRPLLFVHGAWHAGWCWDEHFLNFFASKGYRVLAPSLRGHGSSPVASGSIRLQSISTFVDDVASVAQALPAPPVMIGHSMGGFIVQKYLENHEAPAAVLIASAPPRGQLRSLLRLLRRHPWRSSKFTLTGNPADLYTSTAGARELFFGDHAPDSVIEAVAARLQPDSTRAIQFDMVAGNLVNTRKVTAPILVIGAEKDRIYPPDDVRRTAAAYHTQPVIIADMGHEMMLDTGWRTVADCTQSWLAQRQL